MGRKTHRYCVLCQWNDVNGTCLRPGHLSGVEETIVDKSKAPSEH